jgi:CheY-like chemotaxis protein
VSSPARILVVEDDLDIQSAVADLLEEEGFAVSCASNGAEALRLLDSADAPALIVLDLMMPVMDGWEFRSAQQRDPRLAGIPVLVVSASHGGDRSPVAGMGVDGFLAKPFDVDALMSTVHRLC